MVSVRRLGWDRGNKKGCPQPSTACLESEVTGRDKCSEWVGERFASVSMKNSSSCSSVLSFMVDLGLAEKKLTLLFKGELSLREKRNFLRVMGFRRIAFFTFLFLKCRTVSFPMSSFSLGDNRETSEWSLSYSQSHVLPFQRFKSQSKS